MKNSTLGKEYLKRSEVRLKALQVYLTEKSWPDVVRESQETLELALKGFLRCHHVEFPRLHDVSNVIRDNLEKFPKELHEKLIVFGRYSHELRRDRELAFYGSEDLTPSEFYSEEDAREAFRKAEEVVKSLIKYSNK